MKKTLLLLLTLLLTFSANAQTDNQDLDAKYATDLLKPGTEVPDMVVDSTINLRLSDLKGRYVVLHFWARWCPDCRKDLPKVKELNRKYNNKDEVEFVHISYDKDWNSETTNKKDTTFMLSGLCTSDIKKFHDTESARLFHIKWIPTMYLIDPQGKVVLGTVMVEKLEKALAEIDKSKIDRNADKAFVMPQYSGGLQGLISFLKENLKYPQVPEKYGIEAKTIIGFRVDTLGNISNIELKSNDLKPTPKALLGKLGPEERQRVIKESAAFA